MKRKQIFFYVCLMVGLLFPSSVAKAQYGNGINANIDSIEISLLTCGRGGESYSLYGHTAIRINDKWDMRDIVVNYGLFSFKQKNFVLRFIFGLTDYMMGMTSFSDFINEYKTEGRWVKEQVLDLSPQEKEEIVLAIIENSMPENAEYRYNFIYDNCTTRARDMLVNHIKGKVKYEDSHRGNLTYRDMIHICTKDEPWTRFGNDLLLGVKADAKTTQEEQQFLPEYLYQDFSNAVVVADSGQTRKLIMKERQLLNETLTKENIVFTPYKYMLFLALTLCLVSLFEWVRKLNYWILDACIFTVLGLAGLILTAMIFSQHPTVSLNYQILLLNPLALVGLVGIIGKNRGKASLVYMVAIVFIVLFLICGIWQTYAEGLTVLALSLLIRYSLKWKTSKEKAQLKYS